MRRPDADGSDSESGSRNSPRQSVPDKVGAGQVMSDHLPSDNPSTWPRDPYKLLGVARGASEREVRRAYHNLIRRFKPEHAPEAFRRIREAYEAARNSGTLPPLWIQSFESRVVRSAERSAAPNPRDIVVESDLDPNPTAPVPGRGRRTADVWETAREGDVTLAYERLLERLEHGTPTEEVFLQLYWLRVAAPGARDEQAVGWLIRGLRALGPSARRIQELVRREAELDETGLVCERLADLLSPGVATELVLAAANWRWRAARRLKRWDVIMTDVDALQGSPLRLDPDSWIQILLAASGNGMWANGRAVRKKAVSYRLEAERLALTSALDVSDALNRVDYAECVMKGLRRICPENLIDRLLHGPDAFFSTPVGSPTKKLLGRHLYHLFRNSWDDRGARLRQRLLPYARALTRDPRTALSHLDTLSKVAPAAFGLLMELMGGRSNPIPDSSVEDEVEAFLERSRWSKYAAFRFNLLDFCQCQAIAPDIFAQAIAQHPGYLVMEPLSWHELASSPDLMELLRRRRSRKGARHLGVMITSDRPLAILFHAWQLARE